MLNGLLARDPLWRTVVPAPNSDQAPQDRVGNYRFRWVRMGIADALFESQSRFSTTGATVISDLEDAYLVPHCILFWRSTTHFLGGLGIIVVFVSILGQGSAGKALMRAEMPGPTKEGSTARMQQTAWLGAAVYLALNVVLAIILKLAGLSVFDAICHAFGTMATGGFSTYNASVAHVANDPETYNRLLIESSITLFMVLAGTNFTLLYLCLLRGKANLLHDVEWRTYMGLIVVIFAACWVFIVAVEPPTTWGTTLEHNLIDSASGVAATLNNIGPGLGIVGASRQYTNSSPVTKLLFVWLMMLRRLELFPIPVLFSVRFWRSF